MEDTTENYNIVVRYSHHTLRVEGVNFDQITVFKTLYKRGGTFEFSAAGKTYLINSAIAFHAEITESIQGW